jgi:glycosyltransferase involved in cell wall biosynthesis
MQGLLQWCGEHVRRTLLEVAEARFEDISLRRASVVTAESCFAISWLRDKYPHLDLHQVEHVPNPAFGAVARKPASDPVSFLFVGRLCLLKGSDLLLLALDSLVGELDFRVTLVGGPDPGLFEDLKRRTSAELWTRITLKNNLTPVQIAEEMATATLMLFPTRVDNSPNSVKEAVVAGLPVVASRIGGIPDYVKPGLNGLLFEAGNLEALKRAIREAVQHPLFSRGKVDPGTLTTVRDCLSPARMSQRFLAAYHHVRSCGTLLFWVAFLVAV